ncbi:MAG TPA: NUDIX domain-containing protein [Gemmatimonadales bacterium]|jgi:8-oxo-dGTP pyrophosphatase MutT (NUDIX family)|nr:NUDIX domain-containing protein [Gemmatimonadales bacterium]HEV8598305.1 NUDIX domain-containing protein [Gemmatimonadales bacterium]
MSAAALRVAYIDLLVLRGAAEELEVLCLRRGPEGRSPGSWEAVHGHIDPGETPVAAALREIHEETGLKPERLYSLSRAEAFYRHSENEVVLIPVFAAFVPRNAKVKLSKEHDEYDWLRSQAARVRMSWPRLRREIGYAIRLVGLGNAGTLEDVLRIPLP